MLNGENHQTRLHTTRSKNLINFESDEFRMYVFKIRSCPRLGIHDWTECPYVHLGERARRRDPLKYHYAALSCPSYAKGYCLRGDTCHFAHGVFEYWLHPAKYRTRRCNAGPFCVRKVCFFAHGENELRCEMSNMSYRCYEKYCPEQSRVGVGFRNGNGLSGEIMVPVLPVSTTNIVEVHGGNSEVQRSLAMLNIKNGIYQPPKIVDFQVKCSDVPDVKWVFDLLEDT